MDLAPWVVQLILDLHRQTHRELAAALRAAGSGEAAILPLAGLALGLGMIHALTPGHGKAILFTYFLGRHLPRGRAQRPLRRSPACMSAPQSCW
jgi:ABC-type nickel/cobalt efflux system permease component RcnA